MLNLNILGAASGQGKEVATDDVPIQMPKIITVQANTTVTLTDYVVGTVKCYGLATNGTMMDEYQASTGSADATHYALTSTAAGGVFTPPTDAAMTQYIVKYERSVKSGVKIENRSDKFPQTVKLTLKALAVNKSAA